MDLMTTFGWVAAGTGFTFAMTALGAASVFFFRKKISENIHRMALGLAAGIMIAASVWSLLIPAMEAAEEAGGSGWLPAAGGFILGVAFLLFLDEILPHLHPGSKDPEGPKSELSRASLLFLPLKRGILWRCRRLLPWRLAWVFKTCQKALRFLCLCVRKATALDGLLRVAQCPV